MYSQLNFEFVRLRQRELVERAARRHARSGPRPSDPPAPESYFEGLTLRLATHADRPALARLAELEQAEHPAEPVLLGVVTERPIAALSLCDGRVIADPFSRTAELIELMRLRARQLRCR